MFLFPKGLTIVRLLAIVVPVTAVEVYRAKTSPLIMRTKRETGGKRVFCLHNIQRFIDSAVSTDRRMALDVSPGVEQEESYLESALHTRLDSNETDYLINFVCWLQR